jgi:hypothetical protein
MAGTTTDLLVGENLIGEEVDLTTFPLKLITPLAYVDIYEALQEKGVSAGTALSILTFFGMGLQTYEARGRSDIMTDLEKNRKQLFNEISRLNEADEPPTTKDHEKSSTRVKGLKEQISEAKFTSAIIWANRYYGNKATSLIRKASYRRASDEDKKEMLNSIRSDARAAMLKKYKYRKPKKGRKKR